MNSSFYANEGINGGSIELHSCNATIKDSSFKNCNSLESGGAIFYQDNRPFLQNITFSNNSSPYGPDIGSSPVSYRINISNDIDIPPGQQNNFLIQIWLIDFDN